MTFTFRISGLKTPNKETIEKAKEIAERSEESSNIKFLAESVIELNESINSILAAISQIEKQLNEGIKFS